MACSVGKRLLLVFESLEAACAAASMRAGDVLEKRHALRPEVWDSLLPLPLDHSPVLVHPSEEVLVMATMAAFRAVVHEASGAQVADRARAEGGPRALLKAVLIVTLAATRLLSHLSL